MHTYASSIIARYVLYVFVVTLLDTHTKHESPTRSRLDVQTDAERSAYIMMRHRFFYVIGTELVNHQPGTNHPPHTPTHIHTQPHEMRETFR